MNKYLANASQLAADGHFSDAADICKKVIRRGQDLPAAKRLLAECLYSMGMMHFRLSGLLEEAEENFRAALAVDPAHLNALVNLGAILSQRGQYDEAIEVYQRGLKIDPRNVPVLEYLAKTQQLAGRLEHASQSLLKLSALVKSDNGAYLLREALLVHKVAPDENYPHAVRAVMLDKLAALEQQDIRIESPLRFPAAYFPLSYHGLDNRDLVKRIARIYLKAAPSLDWVAPQVASWKGGSGRLKIGIASAFFHEHSIGNTSRGLIEKLDREKFEVILIRLGNTRRDAMADRIDKSADRVVVVASDDLQSAREAIAALSLDILFYQDIGMEPLGYFLAFARLAPIQLTSFGHPDTTGIPNLDYFLSSANYEIAGAQEHYSERLVMLPDAGTLSCYQRPAVPQNEIGREAFGLSQADRLYLCPQTLFKIHPAMDEIFLGILDRDAAAQIVLIEPSEKELRKALERRLSQTLGAQASRVLFLKSLAYEEFLSLIRCADVMLDTLHFNGQNTSLEAFAMGTPVITLPGQMQRERHTYGMYRAMGFMELVAASKDAYVDLAVRVANDADYRTHCQTRIAATCAVLYDDAGFVRNCEKAFRAMVEEQTAGL